MKPMTSSTDQSAGGAAGGGGGGAPVVDVAAAPTTRAILLLLPVTSSGRSTDSEVPLVGASSSCNAMGKGLMSGMGFKSQLFYCLSI